MTQYNVRLLVFFMLSIMMGFPAQALGVAWPSVQNQFQVPMYYSGMVGGFVSGIGIVSNIFAGSFLNRFDFKKILVASAFLLALGGLSYAAAPNFLIFVLSSFPIGLACGMISTTINVYMASEGSARQMSAFHGFWGVGSTLGASVMSVAVARYKWDDAYYLFAAFLACFACFMIKFFPATDVVSAEEKAEKKYKLIWDWKKRTALLVFFLYDSVGTSIGLFFFSYLVESRGLSIEKAGFSVAAYWSSLTVGRFLIAFASNKISHMTILKYGLISACSMTTFLTVLPALYVPFALATLGLSLSGFSPCLMYATPRVFGKKEARKLVGYQGAAGSLGILLFVPLIGLMFKFFPLAIFPFVLCFLVFVMTILCFIVYYRKPKDTLFSKQESQCNIPSV